MTGRGRQKLTPVQAWKRTPRDGSAAVTEVRTVRDDPACVWILLDGVRAGLVERSTAVSCNLTERGTPFTEALAAQLGPEVERRLCDRSAVRLLAARMRSTEGLVRALTQRGHDRAVAQACAERYAGMGAIDDARYAEVVLRNELARKPAGRRLLGAKLFAHGVRGDDARAALDQAMAGRDEVEDARKVARASVRSIRDGEEDAAVRRRLSGRLARRGFSGEVVRRVVDEIVRERRDGGES
jgi:regulatory protein